MGGLLVTILEIGGKSFAQIVRKIAHRAEKLRDILDLMALGDGTMEMDIVAVDDHGRRRGPSQVVVDDEIHGFGIGMVDAMGMEFRKYFSRSEIGGWQISLSLKLLWIEKVRLAEVCEDEKTTA